eukprot:4376964-Lingulodinium_polyedra.AAC.1
MSSSRESTPQKRKLEKQPSDTSTNTSSSLTVSSEDMKVSMKKSDLGTVTSEDELAPKNKKANVRQRTFI